jgi:hypothetical protein
MPTLDICHCGRHGHVTLDGGFAGPEFSFKAHALETVRTGVENERFSRRRAKELRSAIRRTSLPRDHDDAPEEIRFKLELYNSLRVANARDLPSAHEFLQRPLDPTIADVYRKTHESNRRGSH